MPTNRITRDYSDGDAAARFRKTKDDATLRAQVVGDGDGQFRRVGADRGRAVPRASRLQLGRPLRDVNPLRRGFEAGETPISFVRWWAEKYDLIWVEPKSGGWLDRL